jgi:hypothetical protein
MSRRQSCRLSASEAKRLSVSPSVDLRQAIAEFLPRSGLALVSKDDRLRWVPRMLVICAILMTWDVAEHITDRFHAARNLVADMFPSRRRPGESYTGFMAILRRRTDGLLQRIVPTLRRRVKQLARTSGRWRVLRRVVFGCDGTRIECPMTLANEQAFGTAGKQNTGPQQFLTCLFHVGTGQLWDYRRGPARASERAHLLEMLGGLPANALLLADAGFVGYELLGRIMGSGCSFIVRVGANVKLLTGLGYWERPEHGQIVYLWPERAQKKRQRPLVLRLITLTDERNRRMHLLTNLLEPAALSDAEAAELYRRRWQVEVIYRSLKQVMSRRRMRCDSPANAAAELDWAVIGLWLLGLLSISRIIAAGGSPEQWSVALSLRAVRREIRPRRGRQRSLNAALAAARLDGYVRTASKKARHWPHKKREKPPGDPKARKAEGSEILLAAELRLAHQAE